MHADWIGRHLREILGTAVLYGDRDPVMRYRHNADALSIIAVIGVLNLLLMPGMAQSLFWRVLRRQPSERPQRTDARYLRHLVKIFGPG